MMIVLFGVASGWLATLSLWLAAMIGLLSRAPRGRPPGFGLHFAFGLLVPAIALVHTVVVMPAGGVRLMNPAGLWLATGALGLAILQASLGLALRRAQGATRRTLRPLHLTLTLGLGAAVGAHIWLNRV